jgi:hypothetical protein
MRSVFTDCILPIARAFSSAPDDNIEHHQSNDFLPPKYPAPGNLSPQPYSELFSLIDFLQTPDRQHQCLSLEIRGSSKQLSDLGRAEDSGRSTIRNADGGGVAVLRLIDSMQIRVSMLTLQYF